MRERCRTGLEPADFVGLITPGAGPPAMTGTRDTERQDRELAEIYGLAPAHPESPEPPEGCEFCGGTGTEWRDYWSQDAEPCRAGCPDPESEPQ